MKNLRKEKTPSNGVSRLNGHTKKTNDMIHILKKYEMRAVNGGYGIAEAVINGLLGLFKSTKNKK